MSATRPLITALGTSIILAGCATTGNIITGAGLSNSNSVDHIFKFDGDPLLVEAKDTSPGAALQHPPTPQRTLGWQLGEPDLIVKLSTPYSLPPEGSDVFRNFVIPNVTASDRYVRALELRLDNREVVHHAEFLLDESDASWQRDQEKPETGFGGMDNTTAFHPDGHFVNWVPGKRASELPEGLAWRLPAQADLVVQLHLMPSGLEEVIDPQIGLYFADEPPELSPQMIWLGSRWLPIRAGDPKFTTSDSYELPYDIEILSVLPHCHFICKDIKAWATLPDGSQQWLVRIEKWDFYRQEKFHFKQPLSLPRGTTVSMEFSYDNSADNPHNPNDPPQDINFGPLSSNEMADLWVQVMPRNDLESKGLRRSTARHLELKMIERQERLVELEPDVNGYIDLAQYYRRASRLPEAVTQLQKALELSPEQTTLLEKLAIALTDVGRHNEALVYWRRYVQLAPNDSRGHLNLGTALGFSSQVAEAVPHLKRATELDPSFGPAFFRLGRAQSYLGNFDDALVSFRSALVLNPNEPLVLQDTAHLLATHPDSSKRRPSEALELANLALKLLPKPDAMSLSTLATAQASSGDFEQAATTASLALNRATPDEERLLGPIIQRQLDHYQQGRIVVSIAAGAKRFVAPGERQL
ncbi:MAG: tetratricopeptide repeat protein [Proteobacteria bacterium]|nr:tetratricopeptide repeat protein [Pseudomonadota bacterium]